MWCAKGTNIIFAKERTTLPIIKSSSTSDGNRFPFPNYQSCYNKTFMLSTQVFKQFKQFTFP